MTGEKEIQKLCDQIVKLGGSYAYDVEGGRIQTVTFSLPGVTDSWKTHTFPLLSAAEKMRAIVWHAGQKAAAAGVLTSEDEHRPNYETHQIFSSGRIVARNVAKDHLKLFKAAPAMLAALKAALPIIEAEKENREAALDAGQDPQTDQCFTDMLILADQIADAISEAEAGL